MKTEVYMISGMTCASCSSAVERVTRKIPGVEHSEVNLATNKLTITYDEASVTPDMIISKVDRAGFGAEQFVEKPREEIEKQEEEKEEALHVMKRRLIISIVLAVPLLYLSMGHMLPFPLPLPGFDNICAHLRQKVLYSGI